MTTVHITMITKEEQEELIKQHDIYCSDKTCDPMTMGSFMKGRNMELQELKDAVTKLLVTEYDFTADEAEESISQSEDTEESMWNENADAKDLAKYLASDESNA